MPKDIKQGHFIVGEGHNIIRTILDVSAGINRHAHLLCDSVYHRGHGFGPHHCLAVIHVRLITLKHGVIAHEIDQVIIGLACVHPKVPELKPFAYQPSIVCQAALDYDFSRFRYGVRCHKGEL